MPVATTIDADVSIAIVRDPALVRTVRLVAAAVARRADCEDALVEEIRLAVGEACAVMIGLEDEDPASDTIEVRIHTDRTLDVAVTGRVGTPDSGIDEMGLDPWALLRGLAEDLEVTRDGDATTLRMSWPR